jgi:hypothetical protein
LTVLLPVGLIFGRKDIKNFLALCLGFFIPFIPLIIFDLKTNFFETRNILDYYFYGQYRIYVPNRWLTYAGVFWPKIWSFVIGIKEIVGYLLLILMALISFFEIWKKKIDKNMLSLIVSFFVIFIWLRYYRGELFDSYLIFLHPFVLIFSAWVIYKIFKFNKIIAILLFFVIAFFTIQKDLIEISMAKTPTGKNIEQWKKAIEEKFPNDKFAVYIYKYENSEKALPIILYLNADKRIQDNGRKIGISFNGDKINVLQLKEIPKDYIFINPSAVYKSVEEWYSNN